MPKHKTREEWLNAMTNALRPKFKTAGYPLPKKIGVSCGFPSAGTARKSPVVGECWNISASEGGRNEIFVSPVIADAIGAGAVLVHELIHTVMPEDVHHNGPFTTAHRALGLIDKPTTCVPGAALKRDLEGIVKAIGPYPHAKLKLGLRRMKTQTTRLLKVACPDCGYVVRVTAKWVEVGLPTCPCGEQMEAAA
jgi:hypothetical protein